MICFAAKWKGARQTKFFSTCHHGREPMVKAAHETAVSERQLQPDIAGYIASLSTTNEPLAMCPACQRALLYAALINSGAVKADLDELVATYPLLVGRLAETRRQHDALVGYIAEFVKSDLIASLPGAEDLSTEDWAWAMESFVRARTDLYLDDDGKVRFEPHDTDSTDEGLDGVPA